LYDLIACPAEYAKPTGEWNKSEIIVEKGRITFIVNDKKVGGCFIVGQRLECD
jgi:hypothetical protein